MPTLVPTICDKNGADEIYVSPDANGDEFANSGRECLVLANRNAGTWTVALKDHTETTIRSVSIPAGETRSVGPFPLSRWGERVYLGHSGTIAPANVIVLQVPKALPRHR